MVLTPKQVGPIVDRLYKRLTARRGDAEKAMRYFRGEQGMLVYATDEFREASKNRYDGFSDNWCSPVATAGSERTAVRGVKLPGGDLARPSADESRLWTALQDNDFDAQMAMVFLQAPIQKRAFVSVWAHRDGPDAGKPLVAAESATQAIVEYDSEVRWRRRFGLKVWCDDQWENATFSSADEIWTLRRAVGAGAGGERPSGLVVPVFSGQPWQIVSDPIPNHLGRVPLVELPYRPLMGGEPLSDITGVMGMQDAINLMWSYLFNAADFASLPARVVMGQAPPKVPVLDENGQKIGERAVDSKELTKGRILWLTGQTAKIDSWSPASLDPFTKVIEDQIGHIAAQTKTPLYYFMTKSGIANIGTDAVRSLDTPLVNKVASAQEHYNGRLQDILELVALQLNDTKLAQAARRAKIQWKDKENRSEAQRADAFQKKLASGYPFEWLLIEDGKSPEEIDIIMRLKAEEERRAMLAGVGPEMQGLFQQPQRPTVPDVSQLPEGEPVEL